MWQRLETLTITAPHNSPKGALGETPIDHYVTLLASLSLARCVDQPLDVWLNSTCVRFSVPCPTGHDVRCGYSALHKH